MCLPANVIIWFRRTTHTDTHTYLYDYNIYNIYSLLHGLLTLVLSLEYTHVYVGDIQWLVRRSILLAEQYIVQCAKCNVCDICGELVKSWREHLCGVCKQIEIKFGAYYLVMVLVRILRSFGALPLYSRCMMCNIYLLCVGANLSECDAAYVHVRCDFLRSMLCFVCIMQFCGFLCGFIDYT